MVLICAPEAAAYFEAAGHIRSDEWQPLGGQDWHFNGLAVMCRALTVGRGLKEDEGHFSGIRIGKGLRAYLNRTSVAFSIHHHDLWMTRSRAIQSPNSR